MFSAALVIAVAVYGIGCLTGCSRRKDVQDPPPGPSERTGRPTAGVGRLQGQTGAVASASVAGPACRIERQDPSRGRNQRAALERKQHERQRWLAARRAWREQMAASRKASMEGGAGELTEPVLVVEDAPPAEPEVAVAVLPDVASILADFAKRGDRAVALAQLRQLVADQPGRLGDVVAMAVRGSGDTQLLMAEGLAAIGTEASMQALARLILATPAGDVRVNLVEAAARASNTECSAYLFKTMATSGEEDLLQAAQRALGNMCDQALFGDIVARYAESQDETERDNLLGAIRYISRTAAVPFLAEMAVVPGTDFENPLALAVVDTLGIIGSPDAVQTLFALIDAAPADQRAPLVNALMRVSNPEALELLTAAARGRTGASVDARLAAIKALSNSDAPLVAPILQALLQADDEAIRGAAKAALGPGA